MSTTTALPRASYTVELVEKNNAHYYRVDGKDTLLPGYSSIHRKVVAKPALVKWAGDLAAEVTAKSAYLEAQKAVSDGKWGRTLTEARDAWEAIGAAAPNAKRDTAAGTGKDLHTDLEIYLRDLKLPERVRTIDENKALLNFMTFWATSGFRLVAQEICVAVPSDGLVERPHCAVRITNGKEEKVSAPWPCAPYGGRLDLIVADRADNLFLADFKTGSAVDRKRGVPYGDVWLQLGAYKAAAECTYPGLKIGGLLMFHVRHDVPSEKVSYTCPDMECASQAWLRVRGLYDDLKTLEG